uniref:RING-type domain-containing protein n=3 Tax=Caenorhabditis japonica TaxID=281687 RepID=A0A8R1IRJ5_CAEJA
MADNVPESSNIPTTSNPPNSRVNRGRSGRFRQAPKQEGAVPVNDEPTTNPRGGRRGQRGNYRGRGGGGVGGKNAAPNTDNQSRAAPPGFAFNPEAPTFHPQLPGFNPSIPPPPPPNSQNLQRRQTQTQNPRRRGPANPNQNQKTNQNPNQPPKKQQQQPKNQQNGREQNNSHRGNRKSQGARRREQKEEQLTEEEIKMLANKPLRERLIYQLENNKYECAICYTRITNRQGVWSCKTCYHIFHISTGCITDWAKSSRDKEGANTWRCPTCQTENDAMPYNYFCFCGRQRNPNFRVG